MSLNFHKLAFLVVALSLISTDAFAQRGGRSVPGKDGDGQAETENNNQQAGRRARQGGGVMDSEGAPGSSPAGRGRRGQATADGQTGRFGAGTAGATNPLFAALDADADGVITRAEMENAIVAFARLDEDKDGKLSKEEAGATGGGGHSHGGGMAGRGGARGSAGGQTEGGQPGRGRMQAPDKADDSDSKKGVEPPANSKSGSPFDKK
jgi:EF hand